MEQDVVRGLGAALAGLLLGAAQTSPIRAQVPQRAASQIQIVTVPQLVGRDIRDAARILRALQLTVRVDSIISGDTPGKVLQQVPDSGFPTRVGAPIRLWIAVPSGPVQPEPVIVPSLRDSTPQAAARLLEGLRLRLSQVDSPAGTPNSGLILDQKPPAGTGVAPGTGVSVTLGPLQPTGVRVPWVVGLPVEQARQVLFAAGFSTLAIDSAESSAAPGNVLSQRPDSGAVVEPAATVVALTISVSVQVPPVVPVPEPTITPRGPPWGPIGLVTLAVLVLAIATQKPLRRSRAEREWKRRIRLEVRRDPGESAVPDLGKPLGEPVVGFRMVANPGSARVEGDGDLVREEGGE